MFVRIVNNSIAEVFTPPEGFALADCFHPSLASQFTPAPAGAVLGAVLVNGSWVVPPEPEPPAPIHPIVTPIQFKMLWKIPELLAIDALVPNDPVLGKIMELLEDPKTTEVDLSLRTVQNLVGYVIAMMPPEVVAADKHDERVAEILSGNFS